jgi:Calcineurin-like phosphoesterase
VLTDRLGRWLALAVAAGVLIVLGVAAFSWADDRFASQPSRATTAGGGESGAGGGLNDEHEGDGGGESPGDPDNAVREPSGEFISSVTKSRAVVWAVGDGADGGRDAKALARRMAAGPIDRFLYLGDVYEEGTAADFDTNYATVYGSLARITAPTPGNHDWPNHREGYDPYWESVTGSLPPAFYSFEVAGWQLLSLNSQAPAGPHSVQVRWLREQVAEGGTCRLAFWHRPRYSAGQHGDDEWVGTLWQTLRGRAALVVTAHDHDMQRLKPIDGMVELVSGAGGKSHYVVDRDDPRLAFSNDTDWGALRVELRPGAAAFAFVTTDGRTLDSGTVRCVR